MLVVLTGLAVVVSILGFWVHRTVLETDPFMAAVTPIVESDSVQALAGDRISDQLIEALSLETRIGETLTSFQDRLLDELGAALELPPLVVRRIQERGLGLERLASPLAAGVESRLRDAVNAFMSSPEGTRLLLNVIELTHERTVFLLRDELDKLPNLAVTEGEVRLNLVPLMAEVLRRTINAGLDIAGVDNREIPEFTSAEDADQAVNRLARCPGPRPSTGLRPGEHHERGNAAGCPGTGEDVRPRRLDCDCRRNPSRRARRPAGAVDHGRTHPARRRGHDCGDRGMARG